MRSRSANSRTRLWVLSPAGCVSLCLCVPLVCILILLFTYASQNRPIRIPIPSPPRPAVNGYADFVRAATMVKGIHHKAPASMENPPTDTAGILRECAACAKEAAPGLAVMRRGLAKPCVAPLLRSFNDESPELREFRETARTITGVATYYDMTGRAGMAAKVLLDGDELANMIPRGGTVITKIVADACEAVCLSRLEPLLPRLSRSELAAVASRLDRIAAKRVAFPGVIIEEKWLETAGLIEAFNDPKNQSIKEHYEWMRANLEGDWNERPTVRQAWTAAAFMMADKEAMLRENMRYMDAFAAESRLPYTGRSAVKLPQNPLAQIVCLIPDSRKRFLAKDAAFDLLRVEVALYRYRADRGRFPASLALLAPTYISAVPDDPLGGGAGKPFHYRPKNSGEGFVAYSLGIDLVDNGGTPLRYLSDGNAGDIVAGQIWRRRKKALP